jgi:chemotaxis protein MotB
MTRDGLRIQIVDEGNRRRCSTAAARWSNPTCASCCAPSARCWRGAQPVTLEGHTDAAPFGGGDRGYSNWELSADRANASRRELVAGGLPEDRVLRVQGLASEPAVRPRGPAGAANRRISIIVMNREPRTASSAPRPTVVEPRPPETAPAVAKPPWCRSPPIVASRTAIPAR